MNALGFSKCANYLASVGDEMNLVIWEVGTGAILTSSFVGSKVYDLKWNWWSAQSELVTVGQQVNF